MKAGALRHRLIFRSPVYFKNAVGERTVTWVNVVTVNGSVRPLFSNEILEARSANSQQTHKIETRDGSWMAGYSTSWQIVFETRIFEIEGIIRPDERAKRNLIWRAIETGQRTT